MRFTSILAATALAPAAALAQDVVDITSLTELDGVEVLSADGSEIGEIEDVLIGPDGDVAAFVVEAGGFLGIGDSGRVMPLDRLTFADGDYTTELTAEEVEALPEWDD